MLLNLFLAAAVANTPEFDLGLLLEPPADGPYSEGINAPTVVYDDVEERFHLYFEHPGGEGDIPGRCGVYGRIGHASSSDGVAWTLTSAPVLTPLEDSYFSCGVSQPTVLIEDGTWHMWFKADKDPPEDSGANEPVGIGHATSNDGLFWQVDPVPLILHHVDQGGTVASVGLPSAVALDGVITLFYVQVPDLWVATSSDHGETWNFGTVAAVHAGDLGSWSDVVVTGPAAVCRTDPAAGTRVQLYLGGKEDVDGTRLLTLALAESDDPTSWTAEDTEILLVQGTNWDPTWVHWDVVNTTDGELIYYSRDNDAGKKSVGMASTTETWGTPLGRSCFLDEPVDSGLDSGGETGDLDTYLGDSALDSGTPPGDSGTGQGVPEDTGEGLDSDSCGGCSCTTAGTTDAVWGWGLLIGLVGWRRRQRL
jgi:MYXO-CTERM domain-containing protein